MHITHSIEGYAQCTVCLCVLWVLLDRGAEELDRFCRLLAS